MKLFYQILASWLLVAIPVVALETCDRAHAQFSPPFNAASVGSLGGNCPVQGSIMFQSANALSKCLGTGTAGQVLQSGGPGADLAWLTVAGTGSVTSVALSSPAAFFAVTGSPITTSGTLTQTLTAAAQNTVWAGPGTGGTGTPSYRALIVGDLPTGYPTANLSGTINLTSQVTGTLPVANGGTGDVAFNNLNSLVVSAGASTTALTQIPSVAVGQFLISQGVSTRPAFAAPSGDVSAISSAGAFTVASIGGATLGVHASGIAQFNASTQYPAASGILITNVPGTIASIQSFSTAGAHTYTHTAGATHADVYMTGGGGGGGGNASTGTGYSTSSGGGSGAMCVLLNVAVSANVAISLGAGGTGVSGASGNAGGTSTWGSTTCTAPGGTGGIWGGTGTSSQNLAIIGAPGGAAGTGGTFNVPGEQSAYGLMLTSYMAASGGANSLLFGSGGFPGFNIPSTVPATDGALCGAGGGGNGAGPSTAADAGGNGAPGCIEIIERY